MPAAPPKPWERAGATSASTVSAPVSSALVPSSSTAPMSGSSSSSNPTSIAPAVPERPSTLSATSSGVAGYSSSSPYRSTYGGIGSSYGGIGSSYGGMGSSYGSYGSSYSSPYSRFGGGYGGYGGAYGSSFGSPYGGYGGLGGYGGGYGMGGPMGPGGPGDASLTQRMESGTAATFELISSIVGAFGGFAQMLESTFMATHSSFFAMVGVADQFAHLRNYLGQVLSVFALVRWCRKMLYRLTGREPPVEINAREFGRFEKREAAAGADGSGGRRPKISKRPLIMFFLAVVGLPYLMGKLIKLITAQQEQQRLLEQQNPNGAAAQQGLIDPSTGTPLDPSKLQFVRALYAYNTTDPLELALQPNDVVAVLSRHDPTTGQESAWWRGRTRDGRIGYFPSNYVATLESAKKLLADQPARAVEESKAEKAAVSGHAAQAAMKAM